ncbi:hypothetical protein EV424DRAFT_1532062 [Suillus variegatus]|nr:hypothetical protein EV424DRAFT_1532062 [Suillus variegatus]
MEITNLRQEQPPRPLLATMFQRGYHLHLSTGSGQADQLPRSQSNTGASQAGSARNRNRSTTPDPSSGRSSNQLSIGNTTSHPQSSRSTSGKVPVIPELEIQPPSSPTSLLNEPISAGHLKMYAKKLCEDNNVPTGEVMCFIDSGNIFYMLIDLKVTLIKLCEGNKASKMQELKDALESKDFELVRGQRRLLRIFLIGISNYKSASLEELFSAYLLPSLKQDMRAKIGRELDVNIEQLERDLFDNNCAPGFNDQALPETRANVNCAPGVRNMNGTNPDGEELGDQTRAQLDGGDADREDEELNGPGNNIESTTVLQDDPLDSGFGLVEGIPAQYNNTIRFWNFVDHSLLTMHQKVKESFPIPAKQEKELQKLFIKIFQADLAEFPGGKKISKLISKMNPHWQTAIQNRLIWAT